jgi:hypothetical protein
MAATSHNAAACRKKGTFNTPSGSHFLKMKTAALICYLKAAAWVVICSLGRSHTAAK